MKNSPHKGGKVLKNLSPEGGKVLKKSSGKGPYVLRTDKDDRRQENRSKNLYGPELLTPVSCERSEFWNVAGIGVSRVASGLSRLGMTGDRRTGAQTCMVLDFLLQ